MWGRWGQGETAGAVSSALRWRMQGFRWTLGRQGGRVRKVGWLLWKGRGRWKV